MNIHLEKLFKQCQTQSKKPDYIFIDLKTASKIEKKLGSKKFKKWLNNK